MERIIFLLQIPVLVGATVAVLFGAKLAFACGKRLGHASWIAGVVLFWSSSFIPSALHHHGQYVAWEASHIYHIPGCPYGPNVEEIDTPGPGMRPCDYCAAKSSTTMAAAPSRNPISNATSTVSAAVTASLESIPNASDNLALGVKTK